MWPELDYDPDYCDLDFEYYGESGYFDDEDTEFEDEE